MSVAAKMGIDYLLESGDWYFIEDNGLTVDYFNEFEKEFNYIVDFHKKYDSVPSLQTFLGEFSDWDVYKAENKDVVLDTLTQDRRVRYYAENFNKIRDAITVNQHYDKTDAIVDEFIKGYEKLSSASVRYKSPFDVLNSSIDHFDKVTDNPNRFFTKSGLGWLDEVIKGWNADSDYVVVAGRPGMGKSMLLCYFASMALASGKRVAYYNGEMSDYQVINRILSLLFKISANSLNRGDLGVCEQFHKAIETCKQMQGKFYLLTREDCGFQYPTVSKIESFARRVKADILFIDQQSLITDMENSKAFFEKASNISRQIKAMRDRLNIPIITAVQQNRTKEDNGNTTTAQLAGSDVIGQDATKVIMVVDGKNPNPEVQDESKYVDIHLVKNRDGKSFVAHTYKADFDHCDFIDIDTMQPTQIDILMEGQKTEEDLF